MTDTKRQVKPWARKAIAGISGLGIAYDDLDTHPGHRVISVTMREPVSLTTIDDLADKLLSRCIVYPAEQLGGEFNPTYLEFTPTNLDYVLLGAEETAKRAKARTKEARAEQIAQLRAALEKLESEPP